MTEDYADRQVVGMDLHRRWSVLVQMTEDGWKLVLEATYGWRSSAWRRSHSIRKPLRRYRPRARRLSVMTVSSSRRRLRPLSFLLCRCQHAAADAAACRGRVHADHHVAGLPGTAERRHLHRQPADQAAPIFVLGDQVEAACPALTLQPCAQPVRRLPRQGPRDANGHSRSVRPPTCPRRRASPSPQQPERDRHRAQSRCLEPLTV